MMLFACLAVLTFVLLLAPHIAILAIVLAFLFVALIGTWLGYSYRAAIAKDLSAFQIGTIVSRLETAIDKDVLSMKAAASSVITDLKKLL